MLNQAYLQVTPLNHFGDQFLCFFFLTPLFTFTDDILDVVLNVYYTSVVAMQLDFAICLLYYDFNFMIQSSIMDSLYLIWVKSIITIMVMMAFSSLTRTLGVIHSPPTLKKKKK